MKHVFVCPLSMQTLSEMFELEIPTVHSIISKMIINEELMVNVTATVLNFNWNRWGWISLLKLFAAYLHEQECFVPSYRRHSTSPHRRWWCTAPSPPPCRTWLCSWLRSWAAWWRTTSASLTSNRASTEATSTEVSSDNTPSARHCVWQRPPWYYWLISGSLLKCRLDVLCVTDQKGGYQQNKSYQRGGTWLSLNIC